MLMLIIGASILFGYMMSSLQVTQTVARRSASCRSTNGW
jgi:TRAP-type C4-dicarboxylate transport system permease large subunit